VDFAAYPCPLCGGTIVPGLAHFCPSQLDGHATVTVDGTRVTTDAAAIAPTVVPPVRRTRRR
jgi:hypothetical protein